MRSSRNGESESRRRVGVGECRKKEEEEEEEERREEERAESGGEGGGGKPALSHQPTRVELLFEKEKKEQHKKFKRFFVRALLTH